MSLFHDAPLTDRLRPAARQAEVVVRAGKTFLCTSCGTLVEVPADVVGQLVMTPDPPDHRALKRKLAKMQRTTKKSSGSRVAGRQASATSGLSSTSSGTALSDRTQPDRTRPSKSQPDRTRPDKRPPSGDASEEKHSGTKQPEASGAQPHRPDAKASPGQAPKRPPRRSFAGQTIDGLQVPSGVALDRAVAWVCFRLKVLDQNDREKKRLLKLLKQQRQSARRIGGCRNVHEQRPARKPARQNQTPPGQAPPNHARQKQAPQTKATRQQPSACPKQPSGRRASDRPARRGLPMVVRRGKQSSSSKSFRSGTPRAARPKASRRVGSRCARYAPKRAPP